MIVELGGAAVGNVDNLRAAIGRAKPGSVVLTRVRRRDGTRYLALPIPAK